MKDYRRFLNPEVVSKLSNIDLKARLVVEGFITGLHKSPYHGFSVEFAEHRQYMPGDSTRHIDWKVYAKSDRYYVKEYEEETNLKSYVLLDASGSMGYRSNGLAKLEYGSYLSAALTYLMLTQRDAVGLAVFDAHIRRYIAPSSVMSHLNVVLKALSGVEASQATNVSATFHQLAERIKRRGLIIVISDLFDDPDKILLGLKHFRHRRHDVILMHVLDADELEFPLRRITLLEGLEQLPNVLVEPRSLRRAYLQEFEGYVRRLKKGCRMHRIDYVQMRTDRSLELALSSYLSSRMTRVRG